MPKLLLICCTIILLPANVYVLLKMYNRIFSTPIAQPWQMPQYIAMVDEYTTLNQSYSGLHPVVLAGDSVALYFRVEEYFSQPFINRGIGFDTSSGLLRRWQQTISSADPSSIFVIIGINDLLRHEEDLIAENIAAMFKKNDYAQMHIVAIFPTRRKGSLGDRIRKTNVRLKNIAHAFGADWIDVTNQLVDEEGMLHQDLTYDGLHLNGKGYEILAAAIRPQLPAEN